MKKTTNSSPYQFEGRIPLSQAIPLGLQHVMAMFIGNLTPLIIVMGACGLTADAGFAELRTALLQNAMIIAGIVTLVQMFSIGPVGGKVPIVMGTSSGFLGVLNNTVAACGGGVIAYGAIMGACLVGGIFEGILAFCVNGEFCFRAFVQCTLPPVGEVTERVYQAFASQVVGTKVYD